jgi:integrase
MAAIRKRETQSGRVYDVRYRDAAGWQHSEKFRTRKAAEQRARAIEDELDQTGDVRRRRRTSVTEVANEWLRSDPGKRGSSLARDRIVLTKHVLPEIGGKAIGTVTPADVQALVSAWSEQRSAQTVRRDYSTMRAMFSYAVANDYITASPCRGIKLPPIERKPRHVVTPDEITALAAALPVDYRPMVYLGVVLGLRWGEIAGLRVCDLDLMRDTLSVAQAIGRDVQGAPVVSVPKSSASRRTLGIPQALSELLSAFLAHRGLTAADALLFGDARGKPLRANNWARRVWKPACETAGIDGLVFHDLRRAAATVLVAEGVDPKTAQSQLGHSRSSLTLDLYAQVVVESGRAAGETVAARFMA